jgi:hypothetical protein
MVKVTGATAAASRGPSTLYEHGTDTRLLLVSWRVRVSRQGAEKSALSRTVDRRRRGAAGEVPFATERAAYLAAYVRALRVVGQRLSGQKPPLPRYAHECLGISVRWLPEELFEEEHGRLHAAFPRGAGSLADRLQPGRPPPQCPGTPPAHRATPPGRPAARGDNGQRQRSPGEGLKDSCSPHPDIVAVQRYGPGRASAGREEGGMTVVTRLVTQADLDYGGTDARQLSVSARLEAVLISRAGHLPMCRASLRNTRA